MAASFEDRFDELARLAYRVAYRLLGDQGEAQDVAQEALARAYLRWRRVAGYAEPWVVRVSTNLALGRIRKRRPLEARREAVAVFEPSLASRLDLVELMESLPRRQREVVALRYLADMSEVDVSRLLGCSVGTVKRHAHRGVSRLRVTLALEGDLDA